MISTPLKLLSARTGTLLIGTLDVVIGLTGLSLLLLNTSERHVVLDPFTSIHSPNLDVDGDSYQFLIEYWLPSLFLFFLGVILILAAVTRNTCMVVFSFVLSTLFIAGSLASICSLLISGKVTLVSIVPFVLATLLQVYFYCVVGTFFKQLDDRNRTEDKEMLVISSKA